MDREWPELPSTQLGPTLLVIPAKAAIQGTKRAVWPLDPVAGMVARPIASSISR